MTDENPLPLTTPVDSEEAEQSTGLHPTGSATESDANKAVDPTIGDHENTGGPADSHDPAALVGGPAEDQAPVATDNQKAIVGDSGLYEQEPFDASGNSADQVHRTSAPPAALQNGVPLPEDRAAGVTVD